MTREITIDGLRIYSAANRKSPGSWRKHANEERNIKLLVTQHLEIRLHNIRFDLPATVVLTRIAPRGFDDDNLARSMKSTRDSVAKFLGVDDRHRDQVRYVYRQEKGKPKEYALRIQLGGMIRCKECNQVRVDE